MNFSTASICRTSSVAGAMPSKSLSLGAAARRGIASELSSWARLGEGWLGAGCWANAAMAARRMTTAVLVSTRKPRGFGKLFPRKTGLHRCKTLDSLPQERLPRERPGNATWDWAKAMALKETSKERQKFDILLKQIRLASIADAKMVVRQFCGNASAGSAVEKTNLHKKRLIDFLQRLRLFRQRRGQRAQPYRAAVIFLDDGQQ